MPIKTLSGELVIGKILHRVISAAVALTVAVSSSLIVFAAEGGIKVKVIDGLSSKTVTTDSRDPAQIVAEAGYNLDVNDKLYLDRFSEEDGGTIIIRRARLIRVDDNGIISYILSYDEDASSSAADDESIASEMKDLAKSLVKSAFTVNILHDGKNEKVTVSGGTVGEAIRNAGINLGKDDVVSPSADTPITGKTKISISRVSYRLRVEKEKIPYDTKVETDESLAPGVSRVATQGKEGKKTVIYSDKYVNGALVQSSVKSEIVLSKPVTQVIKSGKVNSNKLSDYYGNGSPISEIKAPDKLTIGEDGAPVNYQYCISGKATAYTDDPITSTGIVPQPGIIAVDPKQIPYGTECYVVSADGKYVYGYCIAADTGGFVKMGNTTIDLYMNTEDMCDDWGNRPVNIYIL